MIKVKDRKLLLLPGDGIGPEVVREVRKIIEWFNKKKSLVYFYRLRGIISAVLGQTSWYRPRIKT